MKIEPEDQVSIKELLYPDASHGPSHGKLPEVELPIEDTGDTLSRAIWISNPGYIPQTEIKSVSKSDYEWRGEEIDYMKSIGLLDKTHNRRRDAVTKYIEVEAKLKALSKNSAS